MRSQALTVGVACTIGILGCDVGSSNRHFNSAALDGAAPTECAAGPLAGSLAPTREGLFREVLFAAVTPRTLLRDYGVDKLDVLQGLPQAAAACGLELEGLLVVGPLGTLRTYHVTAFIRDTNSIRLSGLVLSHERIAAKGQAGFSQARLDSVYAGIRRSPLVRDGLPSATDASNGMHDWSYHLLLARFEDEARYWHASIRDADEVVIRELMASLQDMLRGVTQTYPDTTAMKAASRPDA